MRTIEISSQDCVFDGSHFTKQIQLIPYQNPIKKYSITLTHVKIYDTENCNKQCRILFTQPYLKFGPFTLDENSEFNRKSLCQVGPYDNSLEQNYIYLSLSMSPNFQAYTGEWTLTLKIIEI